MPELTVAAIRDALHDYHTQYSVGHDVRFAGDATVWLPWCCDRIEALERQMQEQQNATDSYKHDVGIHMDALMAEIREQCAQVAESYGMDITPWSNDPLDAATQIAHAIRELSPQTIADRNAS
jgi:hypothetical protein